MIQKLLLGDCLELMRDISDKSVDMVLCDLPYGTTACSWDVVIPFDRLWAEYKRICKPKAAIVLTASQPFSSMLVASNPKIFRHEWIWIKNRGTNPMSSKYAPMKKHESVLVFGFSSPNYYPQMRQGKPYKGFSSDDSTIGDVYGKSKSKHRDNPEGLLYPVTPLEFKCEFGLHPTQKPLTLMEYMIKTYSNEGELVLDNCMGSGTTCLAAKNLNRQYIGIEMNEDYYKKAVERLN